MAEIDEERHVCDAAVTLAFSVLGKRWNGMIVSSLGGGPSTFVSLRRGVAGISDTVLSDRLAELADAGLVSRAVDPGPPVAVSYALTDSGRGLLPILDQLGTWASENLEIRER
ncbi:MULTISPECIES: helix-turn-helix domain-containing protein [Microbacterium]|uniref:winged helix-turn-helix transcriptional regulator n=1 Tax=Microbacterium TaxID=33882 RepID=UPI0006FB2CAC|nr:MULTISPECIES: helix-turn-helix domain-containing protein [Microbacterium]KAA0961786.1 helix-turn-helix transcriptional regulator [Microbacterium sp. ANT_H45B]KQZ23570.1 ArsR family transcriptional regulator [Microbacterium sp. Root553]MCP1428625.1 DNA-binding HxlR family transcriptional regulator [Microbacterium foliorum]